MSSPPPHQPETAVVTHAEHAKCSVCSKRVKKLRGHAAPKQCGSCHRKASRKPTPTMETFRWKLLHHTAHGARLASGWRSLLHTQLATDPDYTIRGDVESFDCLAPHRYRIIRFEYGFKEDRDINDTIIINVSHKLRLLRLSKCIIRPIVEDTELYLREQLAEAHPDVFSSAALEKKPYYLNAMKLLWSEPGDGQQEIHYDVAQRSLASARYSVIFYCTPSYHTAVPNAPHTQLKAAFHTGEVFTAQHEATNKAIFNSIPFQSKLVPAGSGIVFSTSVAHHGVRNITWNEKRIVIFALFCPRLDKQSDSLQRFPLGVKEIKKKRNIQHSKSNDDDITDPTTPMQQLVPSPRIFHSIRTTRSCRHSHPTHTAPTIPHVINPFVPLTAPHSLTTASYSFFNTLLTSLYSPLLGIGSVFLSPLLFVTPPYESFAHVFKGFGAEIEEKTTKNESQQDEERYD